MIRNIFKSLKDKEVLITDTFEKGSLGYDLAHMIRKTARITWCVDSRYKMSKESEGYRIIEDGKVVLLKGDLETEREKIYNKINKLGGDIDYEINIR